VGSKKSESTPNFKGDYFGVKLPHRNDTRIRISSIGIPNKFAIIFLRFACKNKVKK